MTGTVVRVRGLRKIYKVHDFAIENGKIVAIYLIGDAEQFRQLSLGSASLAR